MSEAEPRTLRARQIAGLDLRSFFAIVSADIPRSLLIGISPLILSSFVLDRGFNEKNAAWLSSVELMAAAVAAILVAGWLTRGSRSRLAALGLTLVVVGQLASMFRLDFIPLFMARLIAGSGAGLAGAAATAAAAGTTNPERVFAAIGVVVALLGAVVVGPVGMSIESFGAAGAFTIAAGMTALALPFVGGLPDPEPMSPSVDSSPKAKSSAPNAGAAATVLTALFVIMIGQNAVWGFTVQIGLTTGLTVAEVSWVLALTSLTGLGGAGLAVVINTRHGRMNPLLFAIAGTVASIYVLVTADRPGPYIAGNAAWTFFFAFSMPYFIGSLAALDPRGRWAAIGSGLAGVGGALGPAAAGQIVETHGYGALGVIICTTGLIAAVLLAPVLRRLDRREFA